jgi:glutathione peroxidase
MMPALNRSQGATTTMHDLKAKTITGKDVSLADYKGKVALVVNTASECGYTPQYDGLQKLYDAYKDKGFTVLGFPSNDFGAQEPGTEQEIAKFCDLRFKVKFPLFSKVKVKGADKNPVYDYLVSNAPTGKGEDVKWNFEKFLVGKDGKVLARFPSKAEPLGPEVKQALEAALKAP